jgi:hypothetical protein
MIKINKNWKTKLIKRSVINQYNQKKIYESENKKKKMNISSNVILLRMETLAS